MVFFWGGVVIFFVPNVQDLLGNVRTRFETVCANLLGGQNGHFLAKNSVFELLGPLKCP